MEFVIIAILGVLGAALIAGGIVLYRSGTSTGIKAFGAAAIAAGVVMWALILFVTPAFRATG